MELGFHVTFHLCLMCALTQEDWGREIKFPRVSPRRGREYDEQMHGGSTEESGLEGDAVRRADGAMIRAELDELTDEFREVIVMRDIEGLSYKEIADAADVPIGSVMWRLARARGKLAR